MRKRRGAILAVLCAGLLSAGAPPVPPAPPPNEAKDFLDVREWWGSYTVTVTVREHSATTHELGLTSAHDLLVNRRSTGNFHLDQTSPGGILPGHNKDKPDLAALMDKHRLRTWVNTGEMRKGPTTARVNFHTDESGHEDQPVEGKVHDTFGYESYTRGQADVKVYQPIMLVVDLKKKLYGLIFPYDTINSDQVKQTHTKHSWEKRFDGTYNESTRTTETRGVPHKPNLAQELGRDPNWIVDQPLPDQPGRIKGALNYDVTYGPSKGKIAHVEVIWWLSPKPPEDLELILAPADEAQYQRWRPWGGMTPQGLPSEEIPGRTLKVVATLQKKGGGEPEESCDSITFKLEQVSREPGLCINWPLPSECKDQPDLQFRPQENQASAPTRVLDLNRAVATPRNAKLRKAEVVVSSFDYGAFGLVEAKCELESGRELTAHLKGDDGKFSLRVPRSREGSRIADIWREKNNAQGDDRSDDDNYPVGDKHNGDGLTLYEEYRGYIHRDEWSSLNPHIKDFFVINNLGAFGVEGIRTTEDISNLHVHELDKTEHNGFRVVNFNSEYAHRVDQHATLLDQGSEREFSEAVSSGFGSDTRLGTPKDFEFVSMAGGPGRALPTDDIPHELLHTCNVYHHGECDKSHVPWAVKIGLDNRINVYPATLTKNDDGSFSYDAGILASRIKLYRESDPDHEIDTPITLARTNGMQVWIGMPHGQNSGDEGCHMRYDGAMVYPKGTSTTEYFWVYGDEVPYHYQHLCSSREGYAFNRAGRKPQPRYFDADASMQRGFCTDQILVNDAITAPSRMGKKSPNTQ